jgi:hypothetical protein
VGREGESAANRLGENKKARILSESGPRRVIEWKGARLMRLPCPDASNPRNQATRPVAGS